MSEERTTTGRISCEETFVNTTGLTIPRKYLSISQVNSYLLCPMSYYWKYVEGKKEPSSPAMMAGSAGHKLLEDVFLFDGDKFTDKDVENHLGKIFNDMVTNTPNELKTEGFDEEIKDIQGRLFPSINAYIRQQLLKKKPIVKEIQVQAPVQVARPDITTRGNTKWDVLGEVSFVGFVDFMNYYGTKEPPKELPTMVFNYDDYKELIPDMEIGDYKTGAEKDHTYFMGDYQLPFYSYCTGIRKTRVDNILMSRIKFNKNGSPRKDNVPPSYKIMKYEVQDFNINQTLGQLSQVALGIGSGNFPMCHTSCWKCSPTQCGHWSYCRGAVPEGNYLEKVAAEKFLG